MYEETLLTQIADAYVEIINKFNALIHNSTAQSTTDDYMAILQEIIEMEALFPEIVLKNSPTQRIAQLMTHLGDGVFHTRAGFITLEPFDMPRLLTFLGPNPNGIAILATASLIDLYYIDSVLVNAHLRDGVWTDVLKYCDLLQIPLSLYRDTYIDRRVTISIVPKNLCPETIKTALYNGWVLDAFNMLFTNPSSSIAHDISKLVDCVVVDTDKRMPECPTIPDIKESQKLLFNTDSSDYAYRLEYGTNVDRFLENLSEKVDNYPHVVFLHDASDRNVIGVTFPYIPITAKVVDVTQRYSRYGKVLNRLEVDTQIVGRTTCLPYFTEILDNSGHDTRYKPGNTFTSTSWVHIDGSLQNRGRARSRSVKMSTCTKCNNVLTITHSGLFCTNNRCPGVVAIRLSTLADSEGLNIGIFFDLKICQLTVDMYASEDKPLHLAEVLAALRSDSGQGIGQLIRSDGDSEETLKLRLYILGEILEDIDNTLLYDYTNAKCFRYAKNILTALGFHHLRPRDIEKIVGMTLSKMIPPFPTVTDTLLDVSALIRIGIDIQNAPLIAAEASLRAEELTVLAEHYTPT